MSTDDWQEAGDYVERLRENGHTDEEIQGMMLADGWEEDELDAVWRDLDVRVKAPLGPRPLSVTLLVVLCGIVALLGLLYGFVALLVSMSGGLYAMGPPAPWPYFIAVFAWCANSLVMLIAAVFVLRGSKRARGLLMMTLGVYALALGVLFCRAPAGTAWVAMGVYVLPLLLLVLALNSRGVRSYCTR